MKMRLLLPVLCTLLLASCSTPVEYEDSWLDSPNVTDPSLTDPSYRVSTRPGLTEADRARPVIIAAHGYTASTYEWEEFRDYAEQDGRVLVSLVLLGGHGRSIEVFEKSTWKDWGRPILEEYQALVDQGYTHISLAGSSTGGTLILEQIRAGAFSALPPEEFFFIDPIVVPGNKLLTMVAVVGPILGNSPQENSTPEEQQHWYTNRPAETLEELWALLSRVRTGLADGFHLPPGSQAKVYKTARDETADPVSALLIYKGLREAPGDHIEVEMIDAGLHVFTRLKGRDPSTVTEEDRQRQQRVFGEMISRAVN